MFTYPTQNSQGIILSSETDWICNLVKMFCKVFFQHYFALIKSLLIVSLLSAAPRQDTVIEMEDAQPLLTAQVIFEI